MERADVAVVGAGIVGLATARALQRAQPGLTVVVVEKEAAVGLHQTGRSSGVVHRGVYYRPGSLKAELCTRGAAALLRYCAEKHIPVLACGKLVVATTDADRGALDDLHRRAVANGVPDARIIGPERLRELEPHVAGIAALHSPQTAVVDFGAVARALSGDVRRAGGDLRLSTRVLGFARRPDAVTLSTDRGDVEALLVVSCAGVHTDRLAVSDGAPAEPWLVPFRGDYHALRPERRYLSRGLVYPVPDPRLPFLGVHTTVRVDGEVWLGPNAVLALAREGYGRYDIVVRDALDALRTPGLRRFLRAHWRNAASELGRGLSKRLFLRAAQRLLPELEADDLVPAHAGIRAQALAADGSLMDDFVIQVQDRVVHVRNAPSPGATSSLAIGEWIARHVEEQRAR